MGAARRLRIPFAVAFLLLFASSVFAEYCPSQGGNPVSRTLAARYDREVLLSPSELTQSRTRSHTLRS